MSVINLTIPLKDAPELNKVIVSDSLVDGLLEIIGMKLPNNKELYAAALALSRNYPPLPTDIQWPMGRYQ